MSSDKNFFNNNKNLTKRYLLKNCSIVDPSKKKIIVSDILIKNKLINATNDINLQSIRIHKLITHNGNIGKVLFARFLSTINLDEQTRIVELNISNIEDIVNFIENI